MLAPNATGVAARLPGVARMLKVEDPANEHALAAAVSAPQVVALLCVRYCEPAPIVARRHAKTAFEGSPKSIRAPETDR